MIFSIPPLPGDTTGIIRYWEISAILGRAKEVTL